MNNIDSLKKLGKIISGDINYNKEELLNFQTEGFYDFFENLIEYTRNTMQTYHIHSLNDKIKEIKDNKYSEFTNYSLLFDTSMIESMRKIDANKFENSLQRIFSEWSLQCRFAGINVSEFYDPLQKIINNYKTMIKDLETFKEQLLTIDTQLQRIIAFDRFRIKDYKKSTTYQGLMEKLVKTVNDPDFLYNQKNFNDLFFSMDNNYLNLISIQKEVMTNVLIPILDKINNKNPTVLKNMAELYELDFKHDNSKPIINFLSSKKHDENIVFKISMTKAQKNKDVVMFKDNSISVRDSHNNFKQIINKNEAQQIVKDIFKDYISFKLRKKPGYISLFNEKMVEEYYSISGTVIVIDNFLRNEQILKNNNIKIDEMMPNMSSEKLDDFISSVEKEHKQKQYAHSIASNKYHKLYNEQSYIIIKEIYEANYPQEKLQDIIGKKIASFKSSEDFNFALERVLADINGFSLESIQRKADILGIETAYQSNNILVFKIENFNQSKEIGSPSWCIARSDHYFSQYTNNGKNQYFIFDFNKLSKNNESMIGLTLLENGSYYTAHVKNDDSLRMNDFIKDIQLNIIKNSPDLYKTIDLELAKELTERFDTPETKKTKQIKGLKND